MRRYRTELVLAVLLALTVGAHWFLRLDPRRTQGFFPLSNMAVPQAAESYRSSGAFANGQTLQTPPKNTIPQLAVPRPPSPDRGEQLFARYCAVCHGAGGLGDGTVTRFGVPAPASLLADAARQRSDEATAAIIRDGRRKMPSYAAELNAADRASVVAYIRRLQEQAR